MPPDSIGGLPQHSQILSLQPLSLSVGGDYNNNALANRGQNHPKRHDLMLAEDDIMHSSEKQVNGSQDFETQRNPGFVSSKEGGNRHMVKPDNGGSAEEPKLPLFPPTPGASAAAAKTPQQKLENRSPHHMQIQEKCTVKSRGGTTDYRNNSGAPSTSNGGRFTNVAPPPQSRGTHR